MEDIYDIVKELKDILSSLEPNPVKERIDNVLKTLIVVQEEIFQELNSIDPYSHGDEIGQIVSELMEKVDYEAYHNNY